MTHRLRTASIGLLAAVGLTLLPVASASAHDYIISTDPAKDATVTTPLQTVSLTFNDRVLDYGGNNLVTVTGPDAATRHFETGCTTVADTVVSVPVALGAAGKYTVSYQVVSADGHTVSDQYAFTYQPPAGTTAAEGTEKTACGASTAAPGGESTTGPTTQATQPAGAQPTETAGSPKPTAAASTTDVGLVIGIAIGIVVLALIAVVIVILTARRKPRPKSDSDSDSEPKSD